MLGVVRRKKNMKNLCRMTISGSFMSSKGACTTNGRQKNQAERDGPRSNGRQTLAFATDIPLGRILGLPRRPAPWLLGKPKSSGDREIQ